MTSRHPSRRRFLTIIAATPGLLAAGGPLRAQAAAPDANLHVWRGVALGADAMMQLYHPDPARAQALIGAALAEVARLERVFSLYDPDSALSRLNRAGRLDDPPLELVELLGRSAGFSRMTGGAFDVTVQPLWDLYAAHFSSPAADPAGPAPAAVRAALARVGYREIEVEAARIRLTRPGAAVTLNGIAQGYLTDRVVALLRRAGVGHTLVDMGEIRAMDGRPGGGPWVVGLEDPLERGRVARRIALDDRAVSTSGGYGTLFDAAGRFNHILDPASGATGGRYRSVSVVAGDATTADALSTGFSLLPPAAIAPLARELGLGVYITFADGRETALGVS